MKPFALALCLASLVFAVPATASAALNIAGLRCEYQENPIVADTPRPRLGWLLESDQRGQSQSAYRVLVASSRAALDRGEGDLWDSGKVESDRSIQIPYGGGPLPSFAEAHWKVRVWDAEGNPSNWSEPAAWSMGLMNPSDWNAEWIRLEQDAGENETPPLPLFRREFGVDRPVARARAYICGLGFYELRLNGAKAGDAMFDPGWTQYRETCLYAALDVTGMLREGGNAIGVMLGNGMYNVPGGRYVKFTGSFGPPKFTLTLRIEYADGGVEEIVSDESWRASPGPVVFSCIFGGEDYDARLGQPGWDGPGFGASDWSAAAACESPGGELKAQTAPPIRVMREFEPVKTTEIKPGVTVYDLGQNFSGVPWIQVRGEPGASVRVTPAELITDEGLANQSASGGPHYYEYVCKGGGVETWNPRFTYYGFRYLQVETPPDKHPAEVLAVKGLFTRQSAPRAGAFKCSSGLYNDIHELIDWSVGSNLQSVLTDCPHREKLGWLEVAHLMAPSILYNYDCARFYHKVLRDIRDSQLDNGLIPDIAPEYVVFSGGFRDSPEWGAAGVIIPMILLDWFGDERGLEVQYETMKRYSDYLTSRAEDGIVSHGLGDWFDYVRGGEVGESRLTPKSLTATAVHCRILAILAETAKRLGRGDEAETFAKRAREARDAFNRHHFDPAAGQYATGSQTANAVPLVWDLVADEDRQRVLDNLAAEVTERDYLTAGDVGFRFLLRALADNGRGDLVYRLTHRTDEPGYGYQIQQGATSLTEAWDGRKVVSHNHCMLGHLQEWFHRDLLGIQRDPETPAFKKIVIRPNPVGDIEWAEGHYDSIHGRIAVRWERGGGRFVLDAEIPVNTEALIDLPTTNANEVTEGGKPANEADGLTFLKEENGRALYRAGSGKYRFTAPYGG